MTGAELRRAREAAGLSQERLAALVGVAATTIHRWEVGSVPFDPRLSVAQRLREVLGPDPSPQSDT